jgi:Zn-dependent protease
MKLQDALFMLPGLVLGLTLHEFAHAWVASLLGDGFPRRAKRVSLNPFRHLSILGTAAIFLLPFGWARPVAVNAYNFKRPRRDMLLVSLAGPAANLLLVVLFGLLMLLTRRTFWLDGLARAFLGLAHAFLYLMALINVILAAVNLLPIPPLDGSKIWPALLPRLKPDFSPKTTWVFAIALIVLLSTNLLNPFLDFVLSGAGRLLPTSDRVVFDREVERGVEAMKRERFTEAEAHLTAALAIHDGAPEIWYARASVRFRLGLPYAALEDVNRAISLREDSPYYELRAQVLEVLGFDERAQDDRRTALVLRRAKGTATQTAPLDGDGD